MSLNARIFEHTIVNMASNMKERPHISHNKVQKHNRFLGSAAEEMNHFVVVTGVEQAGYKDSHTPTLRMCDRGRSCSQVKFALGWLRRRASPVQTQQVDAESTGQNLDRYAAIS